MRSELTAQIEPVRSKVETAVATALLAREETKALDERLAPVSASVSEIQQNQATIFERIGKLESQASSSNIQGLERLQWNMLNKNDTAFQQIAILGFKSGNASDRIQAVKAFATTEFGSDIHVEVTNEEKGPKNKRELPDTTLITFINSQARDNALKVLEGKYPKSDGNGFGVSVNIMGTKFVAARVRLQVQKARNLVFRNAFELVKLRASTEFPRANAEFDWTTPTRRILANGEAAFVQTKESLRGTFVNAKFSSLELPAQCGWGAALKMFEYNNVHGPAHEASDGFGSSQDLHVERCLPIKLRRRWPRSLRALMRREMHRFTPSAGHPANPVPRSLRAHPLMF